MTEVNERTSLLGQEAADHPGYVISEDSSASGSAITGTSSTSGSSRRSGASHRASLPAIGQGLVLPGPADSGSGRRSGSHHRGSLPAHGGHGLLPGAAGSINTVPHSVSSESSGPVTGDLGSDYGAEESRDVTDWSVAPDAEAVLQACVFIEDAVQYRSIHHKTDFQSLKLYRVYYSRPVQWGVNVLIVSLLLLAFFEFPSSLKITSDVRIPGMRHEAPCGAIETIELICLLLLLLDAILKTYLKGGRQTLYSKWLLGYFLMLFLSLLDWCITVGEGCEEPVRFRRMLRPFFLLQHSTLMKKTVNCLRRTLPQVFSVLVLLFIHLYFFTVFGMLLFPKESAESNIEPANGTISTTSKPGFSNLQKIQDEQSDFFPNLIDSFMNLLVLLTTANNPDVTMPAYSANRFSAIYFIVFLGIGLYCFMNMLTAVIYNQFRGYFQNSMQTSLFRRRLGIRAAYEVLRRKKVALTYRSHIGTSGQGVLVQHVLHVMQKVTIRNDVKGALLRELSQYPQSVLNVEQFQEVFTLLEYDHNKTPRPDIRVVHHPCLKRLQLVCAHRYFTYFGCVIAFANVICISVELVIEYDHLRNSSHTLLGVFNLIFVLYYLTEQCLKFWALGWRRYFWDRGNVFDGFITLLLVIVEGIYVTMYGIPMWGKDHLTQHGLSLWDLVRIINMLIMIRLLRIIVHIKSMFVVASTLFDLVKNLKSFAGVMVVIYYSYAILGIELFRGKITYHNITNVSCGSYEQLEYWANNFDDFAAALVVLWDVMVVNNWHVFLHAYSKYVNKWAQVYFVVWWLLSVIICLNLFTALILENFIMRWDRAQQRRDRNRAESTRSETFRAEYLTVHDMFRDLLQEPSEEALIGELRQHPHLSLPE